MTLGRPAAPFRWATALAIALFIAGLAAGTDVDEAKIPPPAATADFARDVQPLLEGSCVSCHGAEKQKGKFRLDTRSGLLGGGENG